MSIKTKHVVRPRKEKQIDAPKLKQKPKQKTLLQKLSSFFIPGKESNEHTDWLAKYTRIPKKSFHCIQPIELRRICEKIDPIVVETLLHNRHIDEQTLILRELHPTVLLGYKPICREGDNKNNKPIERMHLIAMVRNFSQYSLPPLVIGHPENNYPAFGYVARIKIIGEYLFAMYQDVPVQLEELVNDGFFNYVSISMAVPVHRRDIGHTSLIHVGLCGGTPPAVTKLGYLRFQQGDIQSKRDGLNSSQKEVIGASFASVPYFKKSSLAEEGYQLIETAYFPVAISAIARKHISLVLQSSTCQEIPLILYAPEVVDPPALGYVGKLKIINGKLMVNFINIPEMVEGFVLEALEEYTLSLMCDIYKKNNKTVVTLHAVSLVQNKK